MCLSLICCESSRARWVSSGAPVSVHFLTHHMFLFVQTSRTERLMWALLLFALAACGPTAGATPAPTLVNQYGTPIPAVPTLNASRVARGLELCQTNCQRCHGANGAGAPDWKVPDANLNFPPPPHNDNGHTWHHSDRVLYEAIHDGLGDPLKPNSDLRMPAFANTLSDADIRAVIESFKSLWSREHKEFQWMRTTEAIPTTPTLGPTQSVEPYKSEEQSIIW